MLVVWGSCWWFWVVCVGCFCDWYCGEIWYRSGILLVLFWFSVVWFLLKVGYRRWYCFWLCWRCCCSVWGSWWNVICVDRSCCVRLFCFRMDNWGNKEGKLWECRELFRCRGWGWGYFWCWCWCWGWWWSCSWLGLLLYGCLLGVGMLVGCGCWLVGCCCLLNWFGFCVFVVFVWSFGCWKLVLVVCVVFWFCVVCCDMVWLWSLVGCCVLVVMKRKKVCWYVWLKFGEVFIF